jgi:shikimate kinase
MNIYLIGMMGAGKTRVGRKLAARLRWPVLDLDHVIEERTQQSIDEIFELHGEAYFRSLEAEAMEDLMKLDKMVISTGGGTPCHSDLLTKMIDTGVTIYLKVQPKELARRLMRDETVRPLLTDLTQFAMEESLRELLAQRKDIYERASYQVNANGLSEDVVKEVQGIVGALQSK